MRLQEKHIKDSYNGGKINHQKEAPSKQEKTKVDLWKEALALNKQRRKLV